MSAVERAAAAVPALLTAAGPAAPLADSPLWACADEHALWGRVVSDPREIEAIAARVRYYSRNRGGRR